MELSIKEQAEIIIADYENALKLIKADNPLQLAEKSYQLTIPAAQALKELVENQSFSDTKEEIEFFKQIKPQICQQLIYFIERYHLESARPIANKAQIEAYLTECLTRYQQYFERNLAFYNYYRMGQNHLDTVYFTDNQNTPIPPEVTVECDPSYRSTYATIIGRFMAYDRIIAYIQKEIHILNNPFVVEGDKPSGQLHWTESKAAFIELFYALHFCGAINDGHGDVKTMVAALENVFQINAGNHYAVFHQNIRSRKINKTSFLDKLKVALKKHMDFCDENARPMTKAGHI